jgi:glutamyl-tRNA reductase
MNVVAISVTYRTAPLGELERAAVAPGALDGALPCLLRAPDVLETVVLSTCNRTEIYAWVRDVEAAFDQLALYFEELQSLPERWVRDHCAFLIGEEAVRHLFAVAAGLDSMVRGESEIQGQVRAAYRQATELGAVGPHLHALFRWALECGKRARHGTGLSRFADSLPHAATRAIDSVLGGVEGREVLIVGSGKVASASARSLRAAGARVAVVARRLSSAEELAERVGGFALPSDAIDEALAAADAAVFATAAPHPILGREDLDRALAERDGGPLVVVDLGLPRNVDPTMGTLAGSKRHLELFDLERLDHDGYSGAAGRNHELTRAAEIVREEGDRCVAWFRARPADSVAAALQARADRIAAAEVALALRKIGGLDQKQRAAVEQAIRHGIRRVIHLPTVRAKEACARGDDGVVEATRWLFDLTAGHPSVANGASGRHAG